MLGLGIGILKIVNYLSSPIALIINAFKSRVAADSGTFEAESCLNSSLTSLVNSGLYEKATLIVTPNAYKASKIYSVKPTDGSGDLAFTRASAKRRRNASGVLEALANNVPALDYPIGGGCPSIFLEPQRTNLWISSSALSLAYVQVFAGTIGTSSAPSPLDGVNWSTYTEANGAALNGFYQNLSVVSGTTYTLSVYVTQKTGSRFLRLSFGANFPSSGSNTLNLSNGSASYSSGVTGKVTDLGQGVYRFEVTQTANGTGNSNTAVALAQTAGGSLSYTGDGASGIYLTGVQFEAGSFASSIITTTTASASRVADGYTALTGSTIGLTGTQAAFMLDFTYVGGVGTAQIIRNDENAASGHYWQIHTNISGNVAVQVVRGFAVLNSYNLFANTVNNQGVKIIGVFNGTNYRLFVNGTKVVDATLASAYTFSNNIMPICRPDNVASTLSHLGVIYVTTLTDAEAIALTTP